MRGCLLPSSTAVARLDHIDFECTRRKAYAPSAIPLAKLFHQQQEEQELQYTSINPSDLQ